MNVIKPGTILVARDGSKFGVLAAKIVQGDRVIYQLSWFHQQEQMIADFTEVEMELLEFQETTERTSIGFRKSDR